MGVLVARAAGVRRVRSARPSISVVCVALLVAACAAPTPSLSPSAAPASTTTPAASAVRPTPAAGVTPIPSTSPSFAPTGRVIARVPLPSTPLGPLWITVADGAPWIALGGDPQGTVERIDPESGRVTDRVVVGWAPGSIAASGTSLWVSNTDGDGSLPHSPYLNTVQRIDTTSARILETVPVVLPGQIVADASGAWVISARHTLVHVSLAGQITGSVALAAGPPTLDLPISIALAGGRIWIALAHGGFGSATLEAIDPATLKVVLMVAVPQGLGWLVPTPAALYGAVVTGSSSFPWIRIELQTGQPTTLGMLPVRPAQFEGVAVTSDGAWLLDGSSEANFGEVIPFDPATGEQAGAAVMPPNGGGSSMIAIGNDVWVLGARELDEIRF